MLSALLPGRCLIGAQTFWWGPLYSYRVALNEKAQRQTFNYEYVCGIFLPPFLPVRQTFCENEKVYLNYFVLKFAQFSSRKKYHYFTALI